MLNPVQFDEATTIKLFGSKKKKISLISELEIDSALRLAGLGESATVLPDDPSLSLCKEIIRHSNKLRWNTQYESLMIKEF